MHYWIPDPLPLPPYGKNLYWSNHILDVGAAWFIAKRALFHKHNVPGYYFDDQEFLTLTLTYKFEYKKGLGYSDQPHFLKYHDMGNFRIVDVGKVKPHVYAFDEEEARDKAFLIFHKSEKGWRVYPRTLRSKSWSAKCTTILKPESFSKLEKSWEEGFDALPEYALNIFDKHNGKPYRFGSSAELSYREEEDLAWWSEQNHPFWKNAQISLLAAAAMEAVAFPEPNKKVCQTFHWTVLGKNSIEKQDPDIFPLTIELKYDGWASLDSDEIRDASPAQIKSLQIITKVLQQLLEKHIPDVPYFLDDCCPRVTLKTSPEKFEIYQRPQFHPWISDPEMIRRTRSAHDALYWLEQLPKDWADDLTTLLERERRQAA